MNWTVRVTSFGGVFCATTLRTIFVDIGLFSVTVKHRVNIHDIIGMGKS